MAPSIPDPLGSTIGHALRDGKWAILETLVVAEITQAIGQLLTTGRIELETVPPWLADALSGPVGAAEEAFGQPLFELLVAAPTGVHFSREDGAQEATAVRMVQRMMGFAVALPFAVARLKQAIEALFGESAPKSLLESIEKIPEDIGINWAMGMVIERILITAAEGPMTEKIAEVSRPSRLEWPQLRALARQRAISPEELRVRLQRAGFRDVDIDLILAIDRQLLSVSDLQGAYAFGLMSEESVRAYLHQLALSDADADVLVELYFHKAETTGGAQLRAVAQREYLNGHLTETQYRDYLVKANVPPTSIDLEVDAANLVKQFGRVNLSVADIKKLRQDGVYDDRQATKRLVDLGYVEEDADALVKEWTLEQTHGKPGLSESHILAYLKGGVLTASEAYDKLVGLGIRSDDAHFLVEHPEVAARTRAKGSTETDIVDAYKDGLFNQDEALTKLVAIGLTDEAAALKLRVANFAVNRGPKKREPHKTISEAQVLEAYKEGLGTDRWAERELEVIGYTHVDAELLVAIETAKLSGSPPPGWTQLT